MEEREREEARRVDTPQSHTEEGVVEKRPRIKRHESGIDTEENVTQETK